MAPPMPSNLISLSVFFSFSAWASVLLRSRPISINAWLTLLVSAMVTPTRYASNILALYLHPALVHAFADQSGHGFLADDFLDLVHFVHHGTAQYGAWRLFRCPKLEPDELVV